MADKTREPAPVLAGHGAAELPAVRVDSYNVELRDAEGFIGDRASKRAFAALLDDWRERVGRVAPDPFGDTPSEDLKKKALDAALTSGAGEAAGIVHGAIEDFAQEFSAVIRRFLRLKGWKDTQRIVVGGGFRQSRVGELAIARAGVLLGASGQPIELRPIRNHPDEAGLLGAVHLAPAWIFSGHEGLLAVDIGGTNIRAGLIALGRDAAEGDLSKSKVVESTKWRHRDDGAKRDKAVDELAGMLRDMIGKARARKLKLAPFVGIACPGIIAEDGSIERGGQNLPGNWESQRFNLPQRVREAVSEIDGHDVAVVLHNDAVVQGLSELPAMRDVERWGALTIGTGLGNARFTNRASGNGKGNGK
jgi:hypothetical protein